MVLVQVPRTCFHYITHIVILNLIYFMDEFEHSKWHYAHILLFSVS